MAMQRLIQKLILELTVDTKALFCSSHPIILSDCIISVLVFASPQ